MKPHVRDSTETRRLLWANPGFLLLWSGQAVSILGDFFGNTAQAVLVYRLTRTPATRKWLARQE